MSALKIVFMGTPALACASLEALLASSKFQIVTVVTQPDRPRGRELKLQPSPVKELAARAGLAILQPERARDNEFIRQLRSGCGPSSTPALVGGACPVAGRDLVDQAGRRLELATSTRARGAQPHALLLLFFLRYFLSGCWPLYFLNR